ncbi:MAG: leucine-rich repeat domain-containing protein, partial [Verrucomicrobiales bacterium]
VVHTGGLNLSAQPLPNAEEGKLPLKLELIRLAGTRITDTSSFAHLNALTELDLSGTAVTSFEPLLGLRLKLLNLANSKVNTLPATVPKEGEWTVDLDGTPLLNPPGYAAEWPFDGWITSTAGSDDVVSGTLSKALVDVQGTAAPASKARAIALPRVTDQGVPPVTITLTCTAGRARVWMEEYPDLFPSPWMKQRKVKGFGVFRRGGYVFAEVAPDKPAKLQGKLHLTTQSRIYDMPAGQRNEAAKPPDWCDYSFYLEPLDGSTVTGVKFAIAALAR